MIKHRERYRFGNKKGAALLVAVVLVGVMLFAALSLATVSIFEVKIAKDSRASNVAYQVADAGMEQALKVILKDFQGETGKKLKHIANEISGASSCSGGEIEVENFGGDPDSKYILMFSNDDSSWNQMDNCEDFVTDIKKIKSKGIYKQNARIIETTLTNP